jgi:hypothetical protein
VREIEKRKMEMARKMGMAREKKKMKGGGR